MFIFSLTYDTIFVNLICGRVNYMQFNKCSRCGCFFVSSGDVCPNCQSKDNFEMSKLKEFLDNSDTNYSLDSISYDTGISMQNLNRYISKDSFVDYKPKINL